MGLISSNHTYLINLKCQIMNQDSTLIKTSLGLVNLAEHSGNASQPCKIMAHYY